MLINGVLQTCHSLFRRFRHEFKSEELWIVIKYVLNKFAQPFTDLFEATVELAANQAAQPNTDSASLRGTFQTLVLSAKIFYSLNSQDLPEFFEDNMKIWMSRFLSLLKVDHKLLRTSDDEEAGLLEQLKSQICDIAAMYAQKYHCEFEPYLPGFLQTVWELLVSTGREPKYDLLVSNAIHFLSTVAFREQCKNLFQQPGVLESLCSKVIIPNIEFRASDEELFEDNPDEYIRMDIEGSDVDTRRRAACDLVKSLGRYFESEITEVFSAYIQNMLQSYAANPRQCWKAKDAAIYLVTAMSVKGSTARFGTTQTSLLVNVVDFYQRFVESDLLQTKQLDDLPILRADLLKYLVTFRQQLPREPTLAAALPSVVAYLTSPSVVVHTYAAHCIDRLFAAGPGDNGSLLNVSHLEPLLQPLLANLFALLQRDDGENEYVMKALTRSLFVLQDRAYPFLEEVVAKLLHKLTIVASNPSKANFNHHLFESLALSIRIAHNKNPNSLVTFEQQILPPLQSLLALEGHEFVPYALQLLALMLELRPTGESLPELYQNQLLPALLVPSFWERGIHVSSASRLLQAMIAHCGSQLSINNRLEGVLGVFQKLISSKANDHEGFALLDVVFERVPANSLKSYVRQVFVILFARLSNSKTNKFVYGLLAFLSLFVHRYGANTLQATLDEIQTNLFLMTLERLFALESTKVPDHRQRRIISVGLTHILVDVPSLLEPAGQVLWTQLLQTVIALFELPTEEAATDEHPLLDEQEIAGFQTLNAKLTHAARRPVDPLSPAASDPRLFLTKSLVQISQRIPGQLSPLIASQLPSEAQAHLQKYLTAANAKLF